MAISRLGNYDKDTEADGPEVSTEFDAIISFVNSLEADKLNKAGGTGSNISVTGTFKADTIAEITSSNGVNFTDVIKANDDIEIIAGKVLKVDKINEITGSAKVDFPNNIKVDKIFESTGSAGIQVENDFTVIATKTFFVNVVKSSSADITLDATTGATDAVVLKSGVDGTTLIDGQDLIITTKVGQAVKIQDTTNALGKLQVDEIVSNITGTNMIKETASNVITIGISTGGAKLDILEPLVKMGNLPTSAGSTGELWNNSGVLNIA